LIPDEVFLFQGASMTTRSKPIIGITSGLAQNKSGSTICQVGQAYVNAITKAGGLPLLIPIGIDEQNVIEMVNVVDGLLFTGGGDIDPMHFDGEPHPKVYGVWPERDRLEFALLRAALDQHLPLLAICRGIQVLNVAFGGTLHTHIQDQVPDALKHDWFPGYPRNKVAHAVSLTRNSILYNIFGADNIPTNSLHHQGIDRVGQDLEAIAFAPDGLVEGLTVTGEKFALGVQWHPECLPGDAGMQNLFRTFVDSCENE
jgi:putative glutamine amidotransferase